MIFLRWFTSLMRSCAVFNLKSTVLALCLNSVRNSTRSWNDLIAPGSFTGNYNWRGSIDFLRKSRKKEFSIFSNIIFVMFISNLLNQVKKLNRIITLSPYSNIEFSLSVCVQDKKCGHKTIENRRDALRARSSNIVSIEGQGTNLFWRHIIVMSTVVKSPRRAVCSYLYAAARCHCERTPCSFQRYAAVSAFSLSGFSME